MLASEILELAEGLEQAYRTVEELETLAPGEEWDDEGDPGE
jgi:hypothetical protein